MSHKNSSKDQLVAVRDDKSTNKTSKSGTAKKKTSKGAFATKAACDSSKGRANAKNSDDVSQLANTENMRQIKAKRSKQIMINYKTEMCKNVSFGRTCKFGDKCAFAHVEEEMKPRKISENFKTKNCENFHNVGFCKYGNKCQFIHINFNEETDKLRKRLLEKGVSGLEFDERRKTGIFELLRKGKDFLLNCSTDEEL